MSKMVVFIPSSTLMPTGDAREQYQGKIEGPCGIAAI